MPAGQRSGLSAIDVLKLRDGRHSAPQTFDGLGIDGSFCTPCVALFFQEIYDCGLPPAHIQVPKKNQAVPTGHQLRVFGREIMNKLHLVTRMAWFLSESCTRFTQKEHPFSAAGGDLSTADGTLPRRFVGHLKSTQGSLFRICGSGKPLGRDGSEFVFVDSSSKETRV